MSALHEAAASEEPELDPATAAWLDMLGAYLSALPAAKRREVVRGLLRQALELRGDEAAQ